MPTTHAWSPDMQPTSHHNGRNHPRARHTHPTPPHQPRTTWIGRAHLTWARLLEDTVAGRTAYRRHLTRRNRAIRQAHHHGITHHTITTAIGLSPEQTRRAIKGEPTTE